MIPVSLQFSSLRARTQKDVVGALKAVAAMGRQGAARAGGCGLEPKEFSRIVAELGLIVKSDSCWHFVRGGRAAGNQPR